MRIDGLWTDRAGWGSTAVFFGVLFIGFFLTYATAVEHNKVVDEQPSESAARQSSPRPDPAGD